MNKKLKGLLCTGSLCVIGATLIEFNLNAIGTALAALGAFSFLLTIILGKDLFE